MKKWIIRAAVLLVVIAIAAAMMVIGRGHTLYFDNKAIDYGGQHYDALHKVVVYVKGEQACKLYEKERGSSTWIGQSFEMDLAVTAEKDGAEQTYTVKLPLPYSIDGIIVNLPALLAGLPQEAWFEEFIPAPEPVEEEEPSATDEFSGIGDEFSTDDLSGLEG